MKTVFLFLILLATSSSQQLVIVNNNASAVYFELDSAGGTPASVSYLIQRSVLPCVIPIASQTWTTAKIVNTTGTTIQTVTISVPALKNDVIQMTFDSAATLTVSAFKSGIETGVSLTFLMTCIASGIGIVVIPLTVVVVMRGVKRGVAMGGGSAL